jgi:hypothetical protein
MTKQKRRRVKKSDEPSGDSDEIDDTVEDVASVEPSPVTRIKILAIEGEGAGVLEALRAFISNGRAAQEAIDDLGAGPVEGALVVGPAPKRVLLGQGGKPLGMERSKRPRRNRSI